MSNRIFKIKPENHEKDKLVQILREHPEIQFVSFMGIDIGGNGTDEKIPMKLFIEDLDDMLRYGIQTDGSSVDLKGIATLCNARVDLVPDLDVDWFIDYNYDFNYEKNGFNVGTLKIPAFLIHNEKRVCSRSILKRTVENYEKKVIEMFQEKPELAKRYGFNAKDIDKVILTSATELELWVQTPDDKADLEALTTSQTLKEQYWKRTHGAVRTVLEKCMIELGRYGLEPEMAHKEVGGISNRVGTSGKLAYVMEQLEIDWKYTDAIQAADNEIVAREVIEDIFRNHGLEVTFQAKPIEGVAGNGEHTHFGVAIKLNNGKLINLFSPLDMNEDFLSEIGYGSLMGVLKNYDVVNPFVTASNDAFNRLKPGFEAPVCVVTTLGLSKEVPSRNRSVLVGVIRDLTNTLATRFELRAPNPLSNTYLVMASTYQAMLDGMLTVVNLNKTTKELEKEISKEVGEDCFYLEKNRAYRSEYDVFEHFTEEERNMMFGKAPSTVWENVQGINSSKDLSMLKSGDAFTAEQIESYRLVVISKWAAELSGRIIPNNRKIIRSIVKIHGANATDLDVVNWGKILALKVELMKDSLEKKSIFTRIKEAIINDDFESASEQEIGMNNKMTEIREAYAIYMRNIF